MGKTSLFQELLNQAFERMEKRNIPHPTKVSEIAEWMWGRSKNTVAVRKVDPDRVSYLDIAYISKEGFFTEELFMEWVNKFKYDEREKASKSRSAPIPIKLSLAQKNQLSELAREIRIESGLILDQVPEHIGVGRMTWARYESGSQTIPPFIVDAGCWVLGLDSNKFLLKYEEIAKLENIYDLKKY